MQWLLHGSLTPAVQAALLRHEHAIHAMTELGVAADAPAAEVLEKAGARQWDVITADPMCANASFGDARRFTRCIVFLQLAGGEVEQDNAIDRLFARYKRLSPGRLYTVTGSRVKVRQLPGGR
jgi:hypothetical protein